MKHVTEFRYELEHKFSESSEGMPVVLTRDERELIGKIINKQDVSNVFDCSCISDVTSLSEIFSRIQSRINEHNSVIARQYHERVLSLLKDCPAIRSEADEIFQSTGAVLVGYKGIRPDRATSFTSGHLDMTSHVFGALRGEGFYITPIFTTALGYSRDAAELYFESIWDGYSRRPKSPELGADMCIQKAYSMEISIYDAELKKWLASQPLETARTILRVYAKDFFNMQALPIPDSLDPLPAAISGYSAFDYIIGPMVGYRNEDKNWEIKFNPHTYEQLICRASTCAGCAEVTQLPNLLSEIREKVAPCVTLQTSTSHETTFTEESP